MALARPIADFVVSLGADGRIASQGSLDRALEKNVRLLKEVRQEEEEIVKAEHEVDEADPNTPARPGNDGKLVVEEEVAVGHVGWTACRCLCFTVFQSLELISS